MRIHYPHLYGSFLKVFSQLIFLCVLLTGLTVSQEPDYKNVSSLIDQLKHSDSSKRKDALIALGDLGKGAKEAVPQMIIALKDPDESVRYFAIYALGRTGEGAEEAVPYLIQTLEDREDHDGDLRRSAAIALGDIARGHDVQCVKTVAAELAQRAGINPQESS